MSSSPTKGDRIIVTAGWLTAYGNLTGIVADVKDVWGAPSVTIKLDKPVHGRRVYTVRDFEVMVVAC